MKLVHPLSSINAQSFAHTNVEPETLITTDGFLPAYSSLVKHFTLYQTTINDAATAVESIPLVHWVIDRLKSWL